MKNETMNRINPAMFTSEYGTIRAFRENDGILFVGNDVAKAFGYRSSQAIAYCYGTTKRRIEIRVNDKVKSVVAATCITPDDCMQLYYYSKLCKADREAVKAFIFESIIPALRKCEDDETDEITELRFALKRAKEFYMETEKENTELRCQLAKLCDIIKKDPCSLCSNRK